MGQRNDRLAHHPPRVASPRASSVQPRGAIFTGTETEMTTEFCPSCRTARAGGFRFCRSCGFDFDAPSQTQQLANVAKTVQNVNVGMSFGGLVGLILGIVVPGWIVFGVMTEPGLAILVPFTVGPIVGAVLGQRAALSLMGR